jgi:hypothetical protein
MDPVVDLSNNTVTLCKRCTSLVHADTASLAAVIVSEMFPELLLSSRSTTSRKSTVSVTLAPNSSAVFFVHRVKTGTVASAKTEPVAFHVHLKVEPIASDLGATDPDTDPDTLLVSLRTITVAQAATLGAPPEHIVAVNRAMSAASTASGVAPALATGLAGTVTMVPGLHGCSQVTISVSVTTQTDADAEISSSSLLTLSSSGVGATVKAVTKAKAQAGAVAGTIMNMGVSGISKKAKSVDIRAECILDHVVSAVPSLHARSARYAEVDEAMRRRFVDVIMPATPPPLVHEAKLIRSSRAISRDASSWRRIHGTVRLPVEYFQKIENDSSIWGMATTMADIAAEDVLSWLINFETYERTKRYNEHGGQGAFREVIELPNSHSLMYSSLTTIGPGVAERIQVSWMVWSRESNGELVLAFTRIENHPDASYAKSIDELIKRDSRASKAVRGYFVGSWVIKPLAKNVCKVSLTGQANVGGSIPQVFMRLAVMDTLGMAQQVKYQYERNSKVVDAELRGSAADPPPYDQLTTEQKSIAEVCLSLEVDSGDEQWAALPSQMSLVNVWMKHAPAKWGERSVALGRAKSIIDCSAKEALSWYFDYCGNERRAIDREAGHPARISVRKDSLFDHTYAAVKRMPKPLHHREFVFRQICGVDESSESLFAAAKSVDESADFGFTMRLVRGVTYSYARFTPLGAAQCSVSVYLYLDAGGNLPTSLVNSKIPQSLSLVKAMRSTFQRDAELDAAELAELARIFKDNTQIYTADDDEMVGRVTAKIGFLDKASLKTLVSPDHLVSMSCILGKGDSSTIITASTTVDASMEECAAHDWPKLSRALQKRANNVGMSVTRINEHRTVFRFVKDLKVPGFMPREWILLGVLKRIDANTMVASHEHVQEHPDFAKDPKYLRGTSSMVLYKYEKLPPIDGVPQTCVSFTQQVDLGGAIPKWLVDRVGVHQLMQLSRARVKFDRSIEIDAASRDSIVEMIKGHTAGYSKEENEIVDGGVSGFVRFEGKKAKGLEMPSRLASAKIIFEGDSGAWGWSTTIARASPEAIMSHLWDVSKRSARYTDDLEKAVDEAPNDHNMLLYIRKQTPAIIDNRDFLSRAVWKKMERGVYVLTFSPEESVTRVTLPSVVRATYPSTMRLTRLNSEETRLEYVTHPDSGGALPAWLTSRLMTSNMAYVSEIQETFQSFRGLELWDEKDGAAVGEVMVMRIQEERHREKGETKVGARMRLLFKKYKGLKEIQKKYGFFPGMMTRVVQNKLRSARDVDTKLCNVTSKKGFVIGSGLSMSLASSLTSEAAVDEWIGKYPALQELDRAEVWLRPMLNTVALRLLSEVSWGLKMRVFIGAGLSILDMVSDINVIVLYSTTGQEGYAASLMWMLATCVAFQLVMVCGQNKTKPLKMLIEALKVLSGLKPAFDAARVAGGADFEEGHVMDPKIEFMASKLLELFCESIPGCLLQSYALMNAEKKSTQAIASIVISAMTTGMASATIAFDFDVDPIRRKETPDFYGYIPDGAARSFTFVCMFVNGAVLLLIRSFVVSLLLAADSRYFLWYSGADMGVYFAQKILRRDFHYWAPVDGTLGVFVSFAWRFINKVIVDYTGNVHFRGSAELGGLYWSFNIIVAVVSPFLVVKLYFANAAAKNIKVVVSEKVAWSIVGLLSGMWLLSSLCFLKLMKKKYRKTFISAETGNEWAMSFFLKGDTDAKRVKPLRINKNKWRKIRPEMKEFVLANWDKWDEERPEFFSDAFKARVDDDMVPAAELKKQKVLGGGQRRSSLSELMGGGASVRESVRSMRSVRKGSATVSPTNEAESGEVGVEAGVGGSLHGAASSDPD